MHTIALIVLYAHDRLHSACILWQHNVVCVCMWTNECVSSPCMNRSTCNDLATQQWSYLPIMYLFVCLLICPSTNRSVYLFVCFSTFLASMINIHNAHIGVFWHDLCWSTHLLYFDTFSLWRLRSLVPFWTCLNHNTYTHMHILVALTICASLYT